jgi:hypothetical protein
MLPLPVPWVCPQAPPQALVMVPDSKSSMVWGRQGLGVTVGVPKGVGVMVAVGTPHQRVNCTWSRLKTPVATPAGGMMVNWVAATTFWAQVP